IGSTDKMGVGTNIQDRAVLQLHLDCPWRPVDIEQREGRIRRPGNQNNQVSIIRLVTAGSADAKVWSRNVNKAVATQMLVLGKSPGRSLEDISGH
ncbi:hypothetical protein JYB64_26715, partial [Algoriphagus aestuarii]|nr:hypothetical protein [Algoriphagus aestuarii]